LTGETEIDITGGAFKTMSTTIFTGIVSTTNITGPERTTVITMFLMTNMTLTGGLKSGLRISI